MNLVYAGGVLDSMALFFLSLVDVQVINEDFLEDTAMKKSKDAAERL